MNDDPLKILHALKVPLPDPAAQERTLHRSLIALQHREAPPAATPPSPLRWLWSAGTATCGMILLFVALRYGGRSSSLTDQRELLRQVEMVFPSQLGAIIEQDGKVNLVLTERASQASDQPVIVTFRKLGETVRVLSYSGRQICLQVFDQEICFEMLMTEEGKVILAGRDFLWSEETRVRVDGCRIEAAALSPS